MDKDPLKMSVEELNAVYGEPQVLSTITHVLGNSGNLHHDLFTVEVITEDSRRLNVRFTQGALRTLMALVGDQLFVERPKAH